MPQLDTRIQTLTDRLDTVQRGRALGVDEQGELIGGALATSFKGKLVRALVTRGYARQGTLSGRVAVALVGAKNFALLSRPAAEYKKSSISNVLKLVKNLETQGLEGDLKQAVTDKINYTIRLGNVTATAADFRNLHELIQQKIIPDRNRYCEDAYFAIQDQKLPPKTQNAEARSTAVAAEALKRGIELVNEIGITPLEADELYLEVCGRGNSDRTMRKELGEAASITKELDAATDYIKKDIDSDIATLQDEAHALEKDISEQGASQKDPTTVSRWELQLHRVQKDLKTLKDSKAQIVADRSQALKDTFVKRLEQAVGEKRAINLDDEDLARETERPAQGAKKRVRFAVDTSGTEAKIKEDTRSIGSDNSKIKPAWIDNSTLSVSERGREQWAQQITEVLDNAAANTTQKAEETDEQFQSRLMGQNEEVINVTKALIEAMRKDESPETAQVIAGFLKHPGFAQNYDALFTLFSNFKNHSAQLKNAAEEIKTVLLENAENYRAVALEKRAQAEEILKNPQQHIEKYQDYMPVTRAEIDKVEQGGDEARVEVAVKQEITDIEKNILYVLDQHPVFKNPSPAEAQ